MGKIRGSTPWPASPPRGANTRHAHDRGEGPPASGPDMHATGGMPAKKRSLPVTHSSNYPGNPLRVGDETKTET